MTAFECTSMWHSLALFRQICQMKTQTIRKRQQIYPPCYLLRHLRRTVENRQSDKMRRQLIVICLQLQVFVAMATNSDHHDDNYTAPSVINVGLLQPLEGPLGFERTGSAASMAVRDAQQRGYLNNTDVKYTWIHLVMSRSCVWRSNAAICSPVCLWCAHSSKSTF